MHKGLFVLDKKQHTVLAGGRDFYPLSQLQSILVKLNATQIGKNWTVALVRQGGDPRPRWRQLLTYPTRPDVTLLAAFRKREDAEAIAAAIADFAGVPITGPPE